MAGRGLYGSDAFRASVASSLAARRGVEEDRRAGNQEVSLRAFAPYAVGSTDGAIYGAGSGLEGALRSRDAGLLIGRACAPPPDDVLARFDGIHAGAEVAERGRPDRGGVERGNGGGVPERTAPETPLASSAADMFDVGTRPASRRETGEVVRVAGEVVRVAGEVVRVTPGAS
jgi:hypothetical protein